MIYGVYAIEDASGRQEFSYGRMGEVVKNIRTFVLPNELNTYTFKMEFRYDSWNRILTTCYPDGEKVSYNYNKGGQLKNMNSNYNGQTYNYINSINYNKFEKRTLIIYGNGARAEYSYDILQRLTRLRSISNSGIMQDIEYKFDNVNNIRFIRNTANTLSNGLGGTYSHEYSYDNMYRLKNSDGNWQGLTYGLNMTYSDDGRILTKNQSGTTLLNGQGSYFSYQNNYSYNVNKHTLNNITDTNDVQNFDYDANGNLIQHNINTQNLTNNRTLCWDEENRLMSVVDNNYTSYYVYDNSGERTFKLTGTNSFMNINGNWTNFALLTNPTLYTSAYLVANNKGYSKHYYAGSERVATSIGKGGLEGISTPLDLTTFQGKWKDKAMALNKVMDRTLRKCGRIEYSSKGYLRYLYELEHTSSERMELFYYHPDHLGSSSWITDKGGYAIQHFSYLPFGENWIEQRNTSWNAPYTFSGKEKDAETGYGYFGARYYDSGLSIWLSVDPMSDKHPNWTPYAYCAYNPIKFIDPDGRDWFESEDGKNLMYIYGKTGEMDGYKNIGASITEDQFNEAFSGQYESVTISANFESKDFVSMYDSKGKKLMNCCQASNAMVRKRGGTNKNSSNALPAVTNGANGRAGNAILDNFAEGLDKTVSSLLNGIPVVAGVDYHNGHPGNKDQMTDHFVAITSVTFNFTCHINESFITSGSLQYAETGTRHTNKGLSILNQLNWSAGSYKASGGKYTLTQLRVR